MNPVVFSEFFHREITYQVENQKPIHREFYHEALKIALYHDRAFLVQKVLFIHFMGRGVYVEHAPGAPPFAYEIIPEEELATLSGIAARFGNRRQLAYDGGAMKAALARIANAELFEFLARFTDPACAAPLELPAPYQHSLARHLEQLRGGGRRP